MLKKMEKIKGFLYSKLERIGSRSEGPEYFLQNLSRDKKQSDKHIIKHGELWQQDPILQSKLGVKVIVFGDSSDEEITYKNIVEEGSFNEIKNQFVLFEYHHFNAAWGYQNNGWFITNSGQIKGYNLKESDLRHEPDSNGYIMEERLRENFNLALKNLKTVEITDLEFNASLIQEASKGQLSQKEHSAYDSGLNYLYCYLLESNSRSYKQILLNMWGDFTQSNLSEESKVLVKWLRSLVTQLKK